MFRLDLVFPYKLSNRINLSFFCVLFCLQNATIATPVFQVIANDPDSASLPSGTLSFRIQDDIEDASAFKIGNMKSHQENIGYFYIKVVFIR